MEYDESSFKKNMSIFHPIFLEHSFFASYPLEKIEASCSILETKIGQQDPQVQKQLDFSKLEPPRTLQAVRASFSGDVWVGRFRLNLFIYI